MEMNVAAVAVAAVIPMIVGFLYFNDSLLEKPGCG